MSPAANGSIEGQARKALYATVLGPLVITILLMFVSGLTLQERPGAKKRYESGKNWDSYLVYLNRTSMLIPFPPQLYVKMPLSLKRTIFLEFPIYVFDPAKHSEGGKRQSISQQGEGQQGEPDNGSAGKSPDAVIRRLHKPMENDM